MSDTLDTAPADREGRRTRVGTSLWGLALVLLGGTVVAWGQGLRFDLQVAAIVGLAVLGVLLVVSAVVRSQDKEPRRGC